MDGDGLIQTIDKLYFDDKQDFNLDYLINELPTNLTSDYLLEYRERLEKLLTVVTRKVSELILSHQPTYVEELQRIADLQKSITESIRACTLGRSYLRFIKDGTAKNGSTIVEHYRKRESLAKLLDSLTAISDLRRSVFEIRSLIDSQEDFPKAIQMCKDGRSLLTSFEEFKCVNELGSKLNDTIELIGEQVDTVLSNMCLSYDPSTYAKLQTSYVLMDRSEIAVDQLLMHFCSTINSQAHRIVINYSTQENSAQNLCDDKETASAESCRSEQSTADTRMKRDYQELCRMLNAEQYLRCLLELCTTFWLIMLNYKRILRWHHEDTRSKIGDEGNIEDGGPSVREEGQAFKQLYVEQKLSSGLTRLWHDMKRKLSLLILNHDFSCYRFDEFIQVLGIVDLVVQIGNEFCGRPSSDDLRDCVNTQALNFFNAYHKSSMDELKMFLENELWEMVPVKDNFKLVQLKEFSFLRAANPGQPVKLATFQISQYNPSSASEEPIFFTPDIIDSNDQDIHKSATDGANLSQTPTKSFTPFDRVLQLNKEPTEDLFGSENNNISYYDQEEPLPLDRISLSTDSDEELNEELNREFVEEDEFISSGEEDRLNFDESTKAQSKDIRALKDSGDTNSTQTNPDCRYSLTRKSGPVLTNSSLNVLRLFGRYIQMMSVLEPISYEILMKIYNLLDHYTMIVYESFGPNSDKKSDDKNLSPKLKVVIRSIRESLVGKQSVIDNTNNPQNKTGEATIGVQHSVSNVTNIITQDLTSGQSSQSDPSIDSRKAVAVESLIFLVNQLWNLQEYLESLIPNDLRPQLRQQFTQNHSIVPDFLKARAEVNIENSLNK